MLTLCLQWILNTTIANRVLIAPRLKEMIFFACILQRAHTQCTHAHIHTCTHAEGLMWFSVLFSELGPQNKSSYILCFPAVMRCFLSSSWLWKLVRFSGQQFMLGCLCLLLPLIVLHPTALWSHTSAGQLFRAELPIRSFVILEKAKP